MKFDRFAVRMLFRKLEASFEVLPIVNASAATMGNTSNDASSFLNNIRAADRSNFIYTLAGGAVFNLANLLLVAAIDMAGLAIAFPVSIGIAMVVGVVSSYVLQPKGNAALLAAGVACAVIAVILDGKAHGSLTRASRSVSRKSIVICVISGILMGLWAPFVTHAMTRETPWVPTALAFSLRSGRCSPAFSGMSIS